MILETACSILLICGAFFMCIAGIGLVRFPDLYIRMSATTKAATFGVGFNLLAAAIHFDSLGVQMRALAAICFIFLTAPVAAHLIGRAAYLNQVPLWEKTICDQLQGRYRRRTHELASQPAEERE
jgi:multicomponent Na+:H+ antiporter subunit G